MSGVAIRELAVTIAPQLTFAFNAVHPAAQRAWASPLRTGKALELFSLAMVVDSAVALGIQIEVPEIYYQQPNLFYLQNVVPGQFTGQAGHSASGLEIDLIDHLESALTPRIVLRAPDGRAWGVFREGHPTHALKHVYDTGETYPDRPDIVIAPGEWRVERSHNLVMTHWQSGSEFINAELRPMNSPIPVFRSFNPGTGSPTAAAIIECSMTKSTHLVDRQLTRYNALMGLPALTNSMFVTAGRTRSTIAGQNLNLRFAASEIDRVKLNEQRVKAANWLQETLQL